MRSSSILTVFLVLLAPLAFVAGCDLTAGHKNVYVLIDVSLSYDSHRLENLLSIERTIMTLHPGDSFTLAKIDDCSFSDDAKLAEVSLPLYEHLAIPEKRQLAQDVAMRVKAAKATLHTDILGAVYQAADELRLSSANDRYLIIFSDLENDFPSNCNRALSTKLDLRGIDVYVVNVTKVRGDNAHPDEYYERLESWKKLVQDAGGHNWKVIQNGDELADLMVRH